MSDKAVKVNIPDEIIAKVATSTIRYGIPGGLAVLENITGEQFSEPQLLLLIIESYTPEEAAAIISHAFSHMKYHPPD